MRVEYINPFVNAVFNTFETMLGMKPERFSPFVKKDDLMTGDISGIIGFADKNVSGSVAVTFPREAAFRVYDILLGTKPVKMSKEVMDSIGELANIIAGGAKQELSNMGISYHISIPTVIIGKNHTINHKIGTPVVVVPFKFESYEFALEICMKVEE